MILRSINAAVALAIFVWWASPCAAVPVASGLVLNFQANNIDGANNSTLNDGQELIQWNDIVVAGGNANANHATYQGGKDYLDDVPTLNTPNYVAVTATGRPGVRFTRGGSGAVGDVLGFNTEIPGLNNNTPSFTAIIVSELSNPGPTRVFQIGRRNGTDGQIVAFANQGFRFNGNSKLYSENLLTTVGPDIATWTMNTAQPIGGSGVNANFRINGNNGTFSSVGNASNTLTFMDHGFAIGAGQGASDSVNDATNGIVYAVLLYNRILSTAEIEEVETFLYNTYIAVPEAPAWVLCGVVLSGAGVVACVRKRRAAVCS